MQLAALINVTIYSQYAIVALTRSGANQEILLATGLEEKTCKSKTKKKSKIQTGKNATTNIKGNQRTGFERGGRTTS